MTDATRSIARVKTDSVLLRAFPGLCRSLLCARKEFGDRVWMGDVAQHVKQSRLVLAKGAWELPRRVCSVRRAGAGVGVLRKQINNK